MSTKLALTLNLGMEDEPLINFLQSFPQNQWEAIIKEALHSFMGNSSSSAFAFLKEQTRNASNAPGKWSLEDLFVIGPPHAQPASIDMSNDPDISDVPGRAQGESEIQNDTPNQFSESSSEAPTDNPLSQLFQLIGEEEDEEVLAFFRQSPQQETKIGGPEKRQDAQTRVITENRPVSLPPEQDSIATSVAGFKGLDFLLNQVIGKEDDPKVLEFFKTVKSNEP